MFNLRNLLVVFPYILPGYTADMSNASSLEYDIHPSRVMGPNLNFAWVTMSHLQ